ncbi:MAG: ArsR/SmtB family transcription factor [Candidatus Hodarchaeales archaeon]|jgi:hypothetical protein
MSSNGDNYWKEELKDLKRQFKELRREIKHDVHDAHREIRTAQRASRRYKRGKHGYFCGPSIDIGLDFGDSLNDYIESILGSAFEGINTAFDGFFSYGHGTKSHHRKSRFRGRRFSKVQQEQFFEKAPEILGLLSDSNRLKLLKRLESGPKYQSDLVDERIQGGTFKHHVSKLMDAGWIIQEKARGRYLITINGREALKFAEFLFTRMNPDLSKNDNENELQKGNDADTIENDVADEDNVDS